MSEGSSLQPQYQQLESALREGRFQAATHVFQELIGLHPDLDALGREIGQVLTRLLRTLDAGPALSFAEYLQRHPAEEVAAPALEVIRPMRAEIAEWERILRDLNEESLARLILAQVHSRDVGAATETAKRFIGAQSENRSPAQAATRLGVVLGSLEHDQDRVEQVVRSLERSGVDGSFIGQIQETRRATLASSAQTTLASRDRAWNEIHTEAVVRLIRALPGGSAGAHLTAEQEQRFYSALVCMLCAYFAHRQDSQFLDVARLLREFCPTDPRAVGPVEGIEDVAFLRINAVDRLASVRALRNLGQ